jgi:hypothetical protein
MLSSVPPSPPPQLASLVINSVDGVNDLVGTGDDGFDIGIEQDTQII